MVHARYSVSMKRHSRLRIVIAAGLAVLAALGAIAWIDTTRPVVRENVVAVSGISSELRILHVSDLHASRFGPGQRDVEGALAGMRFDAAVITGDLLVLRDGDRTTGFELVDVHAPTLVITGSQDLLTPLGDADELAELIPTARLLEVRGVGHALMVEAPNAFNRAVAGFLREVDAATLSAA